MKGNTCLFVFLACFIMACGTTHIITSNPNAEVYINGYYKGKGTVNLQRTGPPNRIKIDARLYGAQAGSKIVRRHITGLAVFAGLYTYGMGFFLTWKYPQTIYIPVDPIENSFDTGFDTKNSVWDLPPGDYRVRKLQTTH